MSAPIAGHAKVSATGVVAPLGARPAPDAVVRAEDVQDPTKLARMLESALSTIALLKARWAPRKVDYEDVPVGSNGALTRLEHGLNGRVRWSVVQWVTKATATTDNLFGSSLLWIQRGLTGKVIATNAGNFTLGCRFQATSPQVVLGARFLWKASTRTVKATLWRDSDGAVLGTGTVSCVNTGVYTVLFATPVVLEGTNLNVDLTLGYYDLAGTAYTNSAADADFLGYLPLTLPGLLLKKVDMFIAGNGRPTSLGGSVQYWIEPILVPAVPQLVENSATDANTLVLTSYTPGTATIRVEAAG